MSAEFQTRLPSVLSTQRRASGLRIAPAGIDTTVRASGTIRAPSTTGRPQRANQRAARSHGYRALKPATSPRPTCSPRGFDALAANLRAVGVSHVAAESLALSPVASSRAPSCSAALRDVAAMDAASETAVTLVSAALEMVT